MAELLVMNGEDVLQRIPLGTAPVHVGRAHTNGLVLTSARVSAHHAVFWAEGDTLWVEDMGSRNGTWVNGERIARVQILADADEVRIGNDTLLKVRGGVRAVSPTLPILCIEDLEAGVRFPLWSDRFEIGSAPSADLRLPDGPGRVATLLVYDDAEVWLGVDGADRPIEEGEELELGGRRFRIGRMEAARAPTTGLETDRYPYRISATLDGAAGPEAEVEHLTARPRYRVEADTRAILLYLLATRVEQDRKNLLSGSEQGWCTDTEIAKGVWGRSKAGQDQNSLNVLVHRVRKELAGAGFEPWFIEKRRRRIRVRVAEVRIS